MHYIDIKDMRPHLKPGQTYITAKFKDGAKCRLYVTRSKRNQKFFVCPQCGGSFRIMYIARDGFLCRRCSGYNPYQGIQCVTRGGYDEAQYREMRQARRYGLPEKVPFDYTDYIYDPRALEGDGVFLRRLKIMQALENVRLGCILFGFRYPAGVFRKITSGRHPLLSRVTTKDLLDSIYNWHIKRADNEQKRQAASKAQRPNRRRTLP